MHQTTAYQQKQIEVINLIENQVNQGKTKFSTVDPVNDYSQDNRMCLTSIHFPSKSLIQTISSQIIKPLTDIEPDHFYYPDTSLHLTIKNIKVIEHPPNFSDSDVKKVKKVFSSTLENYKKFNAYFYRLFMFQNSLALMGTTDEELDRIILDLDTRLKSVGVPDDKVYINKKFFFCNMTLARFTNNPSSKFRNKVDEVSRSIKIDPYKIDAIDLISSNATLTNCTRIKSWKLKS